MLQPGFDLDLAREERRLGNPDAFDGSDLYPDVADCFHAFRKRGLRIGMAGNQPASAEEALESLGLPTGYVASAERWKVKEARAMLLSEDRRQVAAGGVLDRLRGRPAG